MLLFWVLFNLFVVLMLALDLGVLHRRAHAIKFREALAWSVVWLALAIAFAVLIFFWHGRTPALEFVTGYVVELSLSVDNLFVFLLIFRYFRVPSHLQHRVLFWGILGALIMRGIFILVGVTLIRRFHFIIYVFGAFLVYTGINLFRQTEKEIHPENNPVLRLFRRWMPVTPDYVGGKFFIRQPGLYATPLLIVLLVVETTDVLFATDSVPAILAITLDAFIVYTSNVFAILGLRSMYFVLAGLMDKFRFLHYGLAVILSFIGLKMLISAYYPISTEIALAVVGLTLAISILASIAFPRRSKDSSSNDLSS
ncbi:MAG TPA: TerC family protein [Terriglobales bacterium]|nr:TerC family protein [Terriglobales bacterium]